MIFEGLDCPLCGVYSVIVGLDKLEFNFFFIENFFDCMGGDIILDVKLGAKSTAFEIFDIFGECIDDDVLVGGGNGCR